MPGADANPYLAIAASLACGYLGMVQKSSRAIRSRARPIAMPTLPLHLEDALSKLNYTKPLKQVFGERFIDAFQGVKEEEMEQYRKVISSWEREFLLLNV